MAFASHYHLAAFLKELGFLASGVAYERVLEGSHVIVITRNEKIAQEYRWNLLRRIDRDKLAVRMGQNNKMLFPSGGRLMIVTPSAPEGYFRGLDREKTTYYVYNG